MSSNQRLSKTVSPGDSRTSFPPAAISAATIICSTLPPLTEREFQRQVLDLAGILGWTTYHPALSKWSERGWPDLALVRPPRFVLAELKRENGRTTPFQDSWLALLRACPGIETYLWRPSDFDTIAGILR